MRNGSNEKVRSGGAGVGQLLRGGGRVALWAAVALLLLRGTRERDRRAGDPGGRERRARVRLQTTP